MRLISNKNIILIFRWLWQFGPGVDLNGSLDHLSFTEPVDLDRRRTYHKNWQPIAFCRDECGARFPEAEIVRKNQTFALNQKSNSFSLVCIKDLPIRNRLAIKVRLHRIECNDTLQFCKRLLQFFLLPCLFCILTFLLDNCGDLDRKSTRLNSSH